MMKETPMPTPTHPLTLAAALIATLLTVPATAQTLLTGSQTFTGTEGDRWSHGLAIADRTVASLAVTGATRRIRLEGGLNVRGENAATTARAAETVCLDAGAFDGDGNPVANHVCVNSYTIPAADLPAVVWPTANGTTFTFDANSRPASVHWTLVTIDNNCRSTAGSTVTVTATLDDTTTRAVTYTIADDDTFSCVGDSDTDTAWPSDQ